MHRNLDRRVEALVLLHPNDGASVGKVLDLATADTTAAWHLDSSGTWTRQHLDADGEPLAEYQEDLIAHHPTPQLGTSAYQPRRIESLLHKVGFRGHR